VIVLAVLAQSDLKGIPLPASTKREEILRQEGWKFGHCSCVRLGRRELELILTKGHSPEFSVNKPSIQDI
jgi:hypothetical protein